MIILKKLLPEITSERNSQIFNNQNLNHLIVLIVAEIIGLSLIKVGIVKFVKLLLKNKSTQSIKNYLDEMFIFQ